MSINIGPPASEELRPKIMVVGVGGAGGNAIANMIAAEIEGVEFIVANTDAQALNISNVSERIQLGPDITGGLGAGARPEVGKAAAEETVAEIEAALEGVNMCFIAAGMGGGTGTGAAPVIAEAARRKGVLTVGVVTKPFLFEGTRRMRAAEAGIEELQEHVDTLIVIPNQNLFLVAKADTTFKQAFELADEVLQQGVRSITDLMVMPGLINLDFADVRSVMSEMGKAMMGTGEGEGENRALEAAERAIANPLLDGVSMQGAKGVIISIIGGEDMKLLEVDEAANHIRELVDEDANIIWGSAFNPSLDGRIRVSVVATGIDGSGVAVQPGASQAFSLSGNRAPKRPVLELPEDDAAEDVDDTFELTEPSEPVAAQAEPEPYEPEEDVGLAEPAADEGQGQLDGDGGFGGAEEAEAAEVAEEVQEEAPLDLGEIAQDDGSADGDGDSDELLLNADKLAEADEPAETMLSGRRRGLVAKGEATGGGVDDADIAEAAGDAPAAPAAAPAAAAAAGGAGSTLFERMANLSRGSSSDDEDEDEDGDGEDKDGSALSIPRFLGRQNNQ
ncbi:cell division protein FtsZ [Altererythrobacter sp. ZODW24]|uniref:cell division protein FtsZ n=1 Tax=Altererythrobacter sp. ZODW24 TaxID=2185142 RepID=UPI000DF7BF6A|nr:cell division protein FtsZ [Altererythrobacter sp. ZODW24]